MKKILIIFASFMFGVFVWVSDSFFDALFFYEGSFADLLLLNVPKHEIYFRSQVVIFFTIFGIIMSYLFSRWEKAAKALQTSEARYRTLFDTIPYGIQEIDDSGVITFYNSALSKILGYTMGELMGKSFLSFLPSEAERMKTQKYLRYLIKEQPPTAPYYNQNLTKDRTLVDLQVDWNYKRDEQDKVIGFISVITDITERKRAEEQIRASLREKEVLLQEIHHRVNNNMQVIISLIRLQGEQLGDKRYVEMFKDTLDRIKSMALVHKRLYESKDFAKVDINGYVESLVKDLFKSRGVDSNKISLKLEENDISLSLDCAISCGLIINELVTNSIKYAFPEDMKGDISVSFRLIGDGLVEIRVGDNGIGIPDSFDLRNSNTLGLQIVNSLAEHQLGGKVKLDTSKGTEFRIWFTEPSH